MKLYIKDKVDKLGISRYELAKRVGFNKRSILTDKGIEEIEL